MQIVLRDITKLYPSQTHKLYYAKFKLGKNKEFLVTKGRDMQRY